MISIRYLVITLFTSSCLWLCTGCNENVESETDFVIRGSGNSNNSTAIDYEFGNSTPLLDDSPTITSCPTGSKCSPAETWITMYRVWLATNPDCREPMLVADNGVAPKPSDLLTNPILFTGSPPEGTYNCLIIKESVTLSFRPNGESAKKLGGSICDINKRYKSDIFIRNRKNGPDTWYDLDKDSVIFSEGNPDQVADQNVYIYISTDPSQLATEINQYQRLTLGNPLKVKMNETTTTIFAFDFTNKIYKSEDACYLGAPKVAFIN